MPENPFGGLARVVGGVAEGVRGLGRVLPQVEANVVKVEANVQLIGNQVNQVSRSTTILQQSFTNYTRVSNDQQTLISRDINLNIGQLKNDVKFNIDLANTIDLKLNNVTNKFELVDASIKQGDRNIRNTRIDINNKYNITNNKLTEMGTDLSAIKARLQELNSKLERLEDTLDRELVALSATLQTGFALIKALLQANSAATNALRATILTELTTILGVVSRTLIVCTRTLTEVRSLRQWVLIQCQEVIKRVNERIDITEHNLDTKLESLKDQIQDLKDTLSEEICNHIGLHIVGESYYKWDATSQYYPTITFLFGEKVVQPPGASTPLRRRSQIKLRLKQTNQSITEQDITALKARCATVRNFSYNYGTTRNNYVAVDKRFKTTLFTSTPEVAKVVLRRLLPVAEEQFVERNLSTTISRQRENAIKRTTPIAGTGVNDVNYSESFELTLLKVVLMVNGAKALILVS